MKYKGIIIVFSLLLLTNILIAKSNNESKEKILLVLR